MRKIDVLKKHRINHKTLTILEAVNSISSECSNKKVAEVMNLTEQHVARRLKLVEDMGLIVNAKTHPLRSNWVLSEKSELIIEDLKEIK